MRRRRLDRAGWRCATGSLAFVDGGPATTSGLLAEPATAIDGGLVASADTRTIEPERPDTPLALGCLLAGTRLDPSLVSQLRKELASADRVDILCSFIKWSGIRILEEDLRAFTARPSARLRVLTTSYLGATDLKAVDLLRIAAQHRGARLVRHPSHPAARQGVPVSPRLRLRHRLRRLGQPVAPGPDRGAGVDRQGEPVRVAPPLGPRRRDIRDLLGGRRVRAVHRGRATSAEAGARGGAVGRFDRPRAVLRSSCGPTRSSRRSSTGSMPSGGSRGATATWSWPPPAPARR